MPKMKTKSGAKKRFSFTGSGKIRRNQAMKRHNLRKRSTRSIRELRGTEIVKDCDAQIIAKFLPYGSKYQ